ncbi:DUF4286 family protein [Flaviaesturariibacter amylovorans]|uniref:DUF4286 family protein n=1 Tax=Flaviaesturariibacter amylovorans TaxID=1084520 RepID=A0ABP8HQE3_9BACT
MLIYNVTSKVQADIAEAWLQWIVREHGPAIVATGCFTGFRVLRLLEQDDAEGPTFTIQYSADGTAGYERYLREFAPRFRQEGFDKWGNRFIAFRSVMEVIHAGV